MKPNSQIKIGNETLLVQHYPHTLTIECYKMSEDQQIESLRGILTRFTKLPVRVHHNHYEVEEYDSYFSGRGEVLNSDGYGYYPSAQG